MADSRTGAVSGLSEPLTDREIEILACLVEGLSNKAIATRLHLALRTVKWYNSQIYDKLRAENRREAIALASSLGLLQPTDTGFTAAPPNNLPAEATPFIGRCRELAELSHLLERNGNRLITIQGAGGMGKTRLALALTRRHTHRYPDGVYFVPLAPLGSVEEIVLETAKTLGYVFTGSQSSKAQLLNSIRPKRLLLVIDNFEHLIEGAGLLAEILLAAPQVKMIVTSREKLRLQGETTYPIRGMDVPVEASGGNIFDFDAVALFVDAMRRTRPDMDADRLDEAAVTRICQLVGGMPLGIQLAATWLDVLSLEEIADEISRSLDMLSAELRDAPERHHSIRAVFDPTWRQLTSEQQAVFMRLAVFRGGWTREAAQKVAGTSLTDLQSLVNKSLIWRLPTGRYEIHELLRQYAEEILAVSGIAQDIHVAHSQYYLAWLCQLEPDIKGQRQLEILDAIEADRENILNAWHWGVEHDEADAISASAETLFIYATTRTREREAEAVFRQALARFPVEMYPREWGRLTVRRARLMMVGPFGRIGPLREDIERCLVIAEAHKDHGEAAICKLMFPLLFTSSDETTPVEREQAKTLTSEALHYFEQIGEPYYVSLALKWIGYLTGGEAQLDYMVRSIEAARAASIANLAAWTLNEIGRAYLQRGRFADSETALADALALLQALGDRKGVMFCQGLLSLAELFTGKFAIAREHAEVSMRTAHRFNLTPENAIGLTVLSLLHSLEEETLNEARKLAGEASSSGVYFVPHTVGAFVARMIADYMLGNHATVQEEAPQRLKESVKEDWLPYSVICLALISMLLADEGEHVRAAEMLGLALNHQASPRGWLDRWPLLARKQEQIRAKLGTDLYTAAWDRGKVLDWDVAVEQVLAEYVP